MISLLHTTITTVVQPDDYCWLIATNAGIDVNTLLANNPNLSSDCSNLYVGEVRVPFSGLTTSYETDALAGFVYRGDHFHLLDG